MKEFINGMCVPLTWCGGWVGTITAWASLIIWFIGPWPIQLLGVPGIVLVINLLYKYFKEDLPKKLKEPEAPKPVVIPVEEPVKKVRKPRKKKETEDVHRLQRQAPAKTGRRKT